MAEESTSAERQNGFSVTRIQFPKDHRGFQSAPAFVQERATAEDRDQRWAAGHAAVRQLRLDLGMWPALARDAAALRRQRAQVERVRCQRQGLGAA